MADLGAPLMIPADRDGMSLLLSWIEERLGAMRLNRSLAFAVRLCLEEAVQNVVSHSTPMLGRPIEIKVWLSRAGSGAMAVIEDNGSAFDPLDASLQARPGTLDEVPIGGLGLALIRRFSGHALYQRLADLNRLTLWFDGVAEASS